MTLSVCRFEIRARTRLSSALVVGCLTVVVVFFFWFPSATFCLKPYERTTLTTSKVCCVQYLLVFRLILVYTSERLIPGLRRKDWILQALLLAVLSLWPQKVGSRDEIYSARRKLS